MNKILNFLFGSDLTEFNKNRFLNIKWGCYCLGLLIIIQYIENVINNPLYFIEKIATKDVSNKVIGSFHSNGTLPIAQDNIIDKLLLSASNGYTSMIPSYCGIDLIGVLVLIFLTAHYITTSIKHGIFSTRSIYCLQKQTIVCLIMFIVKMVSIRILSRKFHLNFPEYRLDKNFYEPFGWLYAMTIFVVIINIFNYGKKLEEENDLTI
jgi:hypothetical protein